MTEGEPAPVPGTDPASTAERDAGALRRLCEALGVATGYHRIDGSHVRVETATLRAVIRALGVDAHGAREADEAAAGLEAARRQAVLDPLPWIEAGAPWQTLAIRLPRRALPARVAWRVVEESGAVHTGECALDALAEHAPSDAAVSVRSLAIGAALSPGYHRLELFGDARLVAQATLVAAPARCWRPPELAQRRAWGPAVQLYSLRSRRNWGIGDFTDLAELVEFAARRGADMLGLNPLHALFPHDPARASPYSPSSRAWLNTLYLDVEMVEDVRASAAACERLRAPDLRARLERVRAADLVDYTGAAALKHEVLALGWQHFRACHLAAPGDARAEAFRAFQAAGGEALRTHALFEALQEHLHASDAAVWGWPAWPEALRTRGAPAVREFARAHAERVEYFEYLQWLAAGQLARAARRARDAGMAVGLYLDLAVSVDAGGSDTWADPAGYAAAMGIGAPPDDFNVAGQDWGLPPPRPDRILENGCAGFVRALRANMREAGALRIDHVMGLMRLFWIPRGAPASAGTYVGYPFEALMAVVALESHRQRCMIVGEDLGTVPDEVRAAMTRRGLLSCRLLYFERAGDGAYRAHQGWPAEAIASVGSHDLPTLTGWWRGHDLEVRDTLGLLPSGMTLAQARAQRGRDRELLLRALGLPAPGEDAGRQGDAALEDALAVAAHAHLAATPAVLMAVQLEDLLGALEQPNLPGTVDEHPNWRRRLAVPLEALGSTPRLERIVAAIAAQRGRRAGLQ